LKLFNLATGKVMWDKPSAVTNFKSRLSLSADATTAAFIQTDTIKIVSLAMMRQGKLAWREINVPYEDVNENF